MADMRHAGEKRLFCLLSHSVSSALTALWDLFVRKLTTGHNPFGELMRQTTLGIVAHCVSDRANNLTNYKHWYRSRKAEQCVASTGHVMRQMTQGVASDGGIRFIYEYE
jgi:hypothetical protein